MLEKIYHIKQDLGVKLQPTLNSKLETLDKILSNCLNLEKQEIIKKLYNSNEEVLSYLRANSIDFLKGCHGKTIKTEEINENHKYIYRICPIKSLLKFSEVKKCEVLLEELSYLQEEHIYQYISELQSSNVDWINFDNILHHDVEFYEHLRGFSFWTTTDLTEIALSPENLLKTYYTLGMFSDNIGGYSILLRCDLNETNEDFIIPTLIDGYDLLPFLPVNETAKSGYTINVNDIENYKLGIPEFILKKLPVNSIQILPIIAEKKTNLEIQSLFTKHQINEEILYKLYLFLSQQIKQ